MWMTVWKAALKGAGVGIVALCCVCVAGVVYLRNQPGTMTQQTVARVSAAPKTDRLPVLRLRDREWRTTSEDALQPWYVLQRQVAWGG